MTNPADYLPRYVDYIFEGAATHPDRPALVSDDISLSYAETAEKVRSMATTLRTRGVRSGDCIAAITTPRVDAYCLFLALNSLGAVWVALNPRFMYPEMEYVVRDCAPRLVFYTDPFEGRDFRPDAEKLAAECPGVEAALSLSEIFAADDPPGDGPEMDIRVGKAEAERRAGATATLVYTSGTTGKPKGVMLPNRGMIHRSLVENEKLPISPWPIVYHSSPLDHVGGTIFVGGYALLGGGTIVFTERFDPHTLPDFVQRHGINVTLLSSPVYERILNSPQFDPEKYRSIARFVFAGALLPAEHILRLRKIGAEVDTSYGMSELCGPVTYSDPNTPADLLSVSIGKPSTDELRVARLDGGVCEPGESGEIQMRPEFCMSGYFNRPEATAAAFTDDGWFKTGDIVEVLPSGDLKFVGRTSDMFKSGGYNIYPREIEIVLEEHPAIQLASVVGTPDPEYSEVGVAFILPDPKSPPSEDELRAWCRERIANYKVPKRFIITEELPILPIGKLDKVALRKIAAQGNEGLVYDFGTAQS